MAGQSLTVIKSAYLCGPVDAVNDQFRKEWRDELSEKLSSLGVMCFHPNRPYKNVASIYSNWPDHARCIDMINRRAIEETDITIANLTLLGLGTVRDLEYARSCGKPVLAFGIDTRYLMRYDLICLPDMDSIVRWISDYNRG